MSSFSLKAIIILLGHYNTSCLSFLVRSETNRPEQQIGLLFLLLRKFRRRRWY